MIRKGGGNAVVEMQTPDGGQRSITFTGGKATGSDANAKLTATKNDDGVLEGDGFRRNGWPAPTCRGRPAR